MARRKKQDEGFLNTLLESPWQISVILAVSGFVVLRWILPEQLLHNQFLAPFAILSKNLAFAMLFFFVTGLLSYIKQRTKSKLDNTKPEVPELFPGLTYPNTLLHHQRTSSAAVSLSSNISSEDYSEWSLTLLKTIEWKRFELLCAEYFKCLGKTVETMPHGADGGIDVRVYSAKDHTLEYAIQCKSWNSTVGVKPLRELYGVMSHEAVGKGIFMTTSDFSSEAKQFATEHSNKLFLIDGEKFVSMINKLPEGARLRLLAFATEGDYKTPSCPSCGTKLIKRTGKTKSFWGCSNFPKCRTTMYC